MSRLERSGLIAGIVLIAVAAGLLSWTAFVISRGMPGECGGDAPACPPGTTSAFTGMLLAILVLLPLGLALSARRRPELGGMAVALAFAAIAAGVLVSRFVADPITTSTSTTWWVAGVAGGLALLAALTAVALLAATRGR